MILQNVLRVGRPSMVARIVPSRTPHILRPPLFINLAKSNYFTYDWAVENMNKFHRKPIKSPSFTVPSVKNEWCIELCLQDKDDPSSMSFKLLRESDNRFFEVNDTDYELSILDSDGTCLIERKYLSSSGKKQNGFYVPRDEVFRQRKSAILRNNTLSVRCKMSLSKEVQCFARTRLRVEKVSLPFLIDFCSSDESSKYAVEVQPTFFRNSSIHAQLFCPSSGEEKFQVKLQAGMKHLSRNTKYPIDCYTFGMSLSDDLLKEECILDETQFNFHKCHRYDSPHETIYLPLTRNMLMEEPRKYLTSDALSLNCLFTFYLDDSMKEIVFTKYGKSDSHECSSISFNDDESVYARTIGDDVKFLYGDHDLCDFTIRTERKPYPVHKTILCSRSHIFQSMILDDEKQDLYISDVDADTMHRFVRYLYTDNVEDMEWENALKLYAVAEKYEVSSLMKKCSLILMEKLTTRNVCDILLFAYKYDDEDMKSSIRDFISVQDVVIFNSDKWIKMEETNMHIAAETLRLVCLKKRK